MLAGIRCSILLFAIGLVSPVWAVSIYDVIELSGQGYGDEEVVKIIRSTRSVFDLKVEDVPRLKSLGVSETVIRAMLGATPAASSGGEASLNLTDDRDRISPADSAAANDYIEDITDSVSDRSSQPGSSGYELAVSRVLIPDRFGVELVSEEASGDHRHAYVTLTGVPVLILRDEGRYRTVVNRGEVIARNLEEATRAGEGRFEALHANGADMVVFHGAKFRDIPIVTVNDRDVHAYDVRSERRVTSDLLAAYWAALLNDYWAIAFLHRSPSRLVNLHRGDAFVVLFNLVNRMGSDEPTNLGLAVRQLPGTIQGHLERLAQSVPDDFEESSEHKGEAS